MNDTEDLENLERNRPKELFELATIDPEGRLTCSTRIKVPDGFWHLRRIDRISTSCLCVAYRPLYSFQQWDHARGSIAAKRSQIASDRRSERRAV